MNPPASKNEGMIMSDFNPNDYLISLQGKKYLQVPHRVMWFKVEHPDNGAITTELVQIDPFPVVKAFIYVDGVLMATGYGTAQPKEKSVYKGREIEKAETAAIGRALANAGYGTQFSEMFDDDTQHLSDSPVEPRQNAANGNSGQPTPQNANLPPSSAKNGASNGNGDKRNAKEKAIAKIIAAGINPNEANKIEPAPGNLHSDMEQDGWANRIIAKLGKAG